MTTPAPGNSLIDAVEVQVFRRLYDARPSATVSLGTVLDEIVSGRYAPLVKQARHILATHGEKAYSAFKSKLPQVTFGGVFLPTRAKNNLTRHSGLVHADLDHLPNLQETKLQLMQDPHVVYVFRSPSWAGLKYGVKVDLVTTDAEYQRVWQVVCDAHQAQYGITWDPSGRDVSRLSFCSWDPTGFIHPDAEVCVVPPMVVPPPSTVTGYRHWPSPRFNTAAQQALERAERLIAHAPAGSRHTARLKAAYLIGGYLASTDLSYDEAIVRLLSAALANADSEGEARRDIIDGLTAGQHKPITTPYPGRRSGDWQHNTVTPKEGPSWRKC